MSNPFQDRLDEISDAKKREYLDAAVDNHGQQFRGRIPTSKEKLDKRRAMIQKVATKVTGQKHYSDMDGKPYNAASGKKYSESVEMDEAFTYTQKLHAIRVDPIGSTPKHLLGKIGMYGEKSNLGNDAEYKKALDDAHAHGKEKFDGKYEITHVDHRNHKIRGGSVAKVRKGMAQTSESVEQIEELSQDTLKKAVDSGKAKQKMAQSFADTSDREEDKDWHQSKADKFKAQVKKIASRVKESEELEEADKHSFIGKIQRHIELKKKVDSTFKEVGDAQKRGDKQAVARNMSKHVRYANLERPGTWTNVKESEELDESFSDAQIAKLKSSYSTISTIDPDSDTYKKLLALLDKQDVATLKKLADAKIKFVSGLALNRYNRKKPKNESVDQVEEENETFNKKSHQYKTTLKHIKDPDVTQRMAAHDIKPGIAGYRDRIDLLKDAAAKGKLKEGYTEAPSEVEKLNADVKRTGKSHAELAQAHREHAEKMERMGHKALAYRSAQLAKQHANQAANESEELDEKTLTSAELKKREEVAKAMEKDQPSIDKSKKMAIATAVAKRVAENEQLDEAQYITQEHPHYEKMMKEFGDKVAKIKPNDKAHVGNYSYGKNVYQSTMASKTKTGKVRFWHVK